jgi:hypothetical protein
MGDPLKAKRYRERAESLHKIAGDLPAGNTQRMLIGIAMEYDRLARLLDDDAPAALDPTEKIAALKKPDKTE